MHGVPKLDSARHEHMMCKLPHALGSRHPGYAYRQYQAYCGCCISNSKGKVTQHVGTFDFFCFLAFASPASCSASWSSAAAELPGSSPPRVMTGSTASQDVHVPHLYPRTQAPYLHSVHTREGSLTATSTSQWVTSLSAGKMPGGPRRLLCACKALLTSRIGLQDIGRSRVEPQQAAARRPAAPGQLICSAMLCFLACHTRCHQGLQAGPQAPCYMGCGEKRKRRTHSCKIGRQGRIRGAAVDPCQGEREGWQHNIMVHIKIGLP